jgi:lipoprotein NlpD
MQNTAHNRINNKFKVLTCCASLLLTACAQTSHTPAPIISAQDARAMQTGSTENTVISNAAETTPLTMSSGNIRPVTMPAGTRETTHTVQAGENLYRISVNNGLRHQDVAQWNALENFDIKVGQVLRLTAPGSNTATPAIRQTANTITSPTTDIGSKGSSAVKSYPKALKLPYSENASKSLAQQSEGTSGVASGASIAASKPAIPTLPASKTPPAKVVASEPEKQVTETSSKPSAQISSTVGWIWPTEGKVVRRFSEQNKGLDIAGSMGQAIIAAGDGKVVYSGSGLKGYGKLIIIKHDKVFLSAYAHNSELLVKEGQSIKKGQKIATMGNSDTDQVKLHFEIREYGKPVNPDKYLAN